MLGFENGVGWEGRVRMCDVGELFRLAMSPWTRVKQHIHIHRGLSIISHCLMPTNNRPIRRKTLAIP